MPITDDGIGEFTTYFTTMDVFQSNLLRFQLFGFMLDRLTRLVSMIQPNVQYGKTWTIGITFQII